MVHTDSTTPSDVRPQAPVGDTPGTSDRGQTPQPAHKYRFPTLIDLLALVGIWYLLQFVGLLAARLAGFDFPDWDLLRGNVAPTPEQQDALARFTAFTYLVTMGLMILFTLFYRRLRHGTRKTLRFSARGLNPVLLLWGLVMMLAWVLLDVLLEIFPERYITPAVVGVTLLGWGVTLVWEAPFCIAQGMVSLPYLYIGYLAKKRRLFETPLSGRARAGLIVSALGVVAGVLLTQSTDCVSLGEWTMGPLSILLDGAVGYGIIRLFLKWQRRVDGPISHAIEWVGRRSLFIFCIHTVELTAIPWYLMAAKYADHPVQGMLLQFVFSLVSIFAVTELLMRRKELGRKLRGGKPADKPRQRSRTRRYAAKH